MVTATKRERIYRRDKYTCQYCGAPLTEPTATIDHKLCRINGGNNHESNLFSCCRTCNTQKGTKSVEQFREYKELLSTPYGDILNLPQFRKLCALGIDFGKTPKYTFFFEKNEQSEGAF